jgi:hypothetical protein
MKLVWFYITRSPFSSVQCPRLTEGRHADSGTLCVWLSRSMTSNAASKSVRVPQRASVSERKRMPYILFVFH